MLETFATGIVGVDPSVIAIKRNNEAIDYVQFSVAVKQGKDKTQWLNVSCRGDTSTAKFVMEYIKKGDRVALRGSAEAKAYINRDGVAIATFNVYANAVEKTSNDKYKDNTTETVQEQSVLTTNNYEY